MAARCNTQHDELLEPYRGHLVERWGKYKKMKQELEAHEGGLLEFSRVCIYLLIQSRNSRWLELTLWVEMFSYSVFHDVYSRVISSCPLKLTARDTNNMGYSSSQVGGFRTENGHLRLVKYR